MMQACRVCLLICCQRLLHITTSTIVKQRPHGECMPNSLCLLQQLPACTHILHTHHLCLLHKQCQHTQQHIGRRPPPQRPTITTATANGVDMSVNDVDTHQG
ncbi:hypothetical protein B0H34DRAFT_135264 [Crassisporium funariophilum]|nr:hypothetical protein B0H34DRAFT_135264 [Crassisporium funariophilum]